MVKYAESVKIRAMSSQGSSGRSRVLLRSGTDRLGDERDSIPAFDGWSTGPVEFTDPARTWPQ